MEQTTFAGRLSLTLSRDTLFERIRDAGDQDAWRIVYDRYAPLVFAVARRSGLDRDLAADAQQETLSAYAEAIRAGRVNSNNEGGSPRGYLFQIATNKIADIIKKQRRQFAQVAGDADQTDFFLRVPDRQIQMQIWEEERIILIRDQCLREAEQHFESATLMMYRMQAHDGHRAEDAARALGKARNAAYLAHSRVRAFLEDILPIVDRSF